MLSLLLHVPDMYCCHYCSQSFPRHGLSLHKVSCKSFFAGPAHSGRARSCKFLLPPPRGPHRLLLLVVLLILPFSGAGTGPGASRRGYRVLSAALLGL